MPAVDEEPSEPFAQQYLVLDDYAVAGEAGRRRVTLSELRLRRADLYAVAQRYGISNIWVVGSVARDDADDASDVDLLVDLAPGRGLFDLGGFVSGAEAALGVHVDVTTVGGLRPRLRPRVLAEAVAL